MTEIIILVIVIAIAVVFFFFMLITGSHEKRITKLKQTIIKDRVFVADLFNEQLKNKQTIMKGKTQVSISIETELREKLDLYAKETRRNRSQAVETLIAEYSIDKASVINSQAQMIKDLEKELILLKSDTVVLPEIDKDLIEQNEELTKKVEKLDKTVLNLKALCARKNLELIEIAGFASQIIKKAAL